LFLPDVMPSYRRNVHHSRSSVVEIEERAVPPRLPETVRAEHAVIIGVDVGGTTISAGLVTPQGEVVDALQLPTRGESGSPASALFEILGLITARGRDRGLTLSGVGVGVPGLVDTEKGILVATENYVPELAQIPLAERVHALTSLPAFVDNDVNALALGEWMFGLGRGAASLVILAIGSGLGGGMVLDGRLIRGRSGYAGEWGHVPVNFDGSQCFCGGRGCVATYVGGTIIAAEAKARVARYPDSALLALTGGDAAAITSALVFEAAVGGDPLAKQMVDEVCEALGACLAAVVNAVNPEVIVVTGGVVESLLPLQEDILRRAGRYALPQALADARIHFVRADKRRTVVGGAALVLYELARRDRPLAPREARSSMEA
jgi:glucokinase